MSESGAKIKLDEQEEKSKVGNRKKLDSNELKKLTPQQRSRYMAYEDPAKEITDAQAASKKRVIESKKKSQRDNACTPALERVEKDKHITLIGQLKAAEARNRLRITRLRFQANRGQEINHLISCQPTALNAVRLEALLPITSAKYDKKDAMDQLDRERCELLIQDEQGLLTLRVA